jgi:maleate isomerase
MNRVTLDSLLDFAAYVDRPDAEAVFLSCGALRSVEILEAAEARLGKPVICSNQASLWECLRLAGVQDRVAGFGSLLSTL